jgi:uncharacterized protein with GYD domain
MARFLIEASYTEEGIKALREPEAPRTNVAVDHRASIAKAAEGLGGKLESLYFFSVGSHDVMMIVDLPDAAAVNEASATLAATAAGLYRTKTMPLLTAEEIDAAAREAANKG